MSKKHKVIIVKKNRFDNKIISEKTEFFFSIYNARRRVNEINDQKINDGPNVITTVKLEQMVA